MFTTDQLEELERLIASGASKYKHADREEAYQGLDELMNLRDRMKRELGLVGSDSGRRVAYATYSKGIS
jgi:hypothetical protein